ncbi:MAG: Homoserine dehydrogenase [Verrucomicrobiota bacterium]|jgi:homoserine dehydrogenase
MQHPIGIGLAGLGNVGAGVFKHLQQNRALLRERIGMDLEVRKVAVQNATRRRAEGYPPELLTENWRELVADPSVQIVVEVMGRREESLALILAAIAAKKIVVTANKALLAEHGPRIFEAARQNQVPVFFEAAVGGGIPIIKSLREALIGNHITSIHGIINGTSNYILTRMTEADLGFQEALAEAQAAGYAEPDPSFDVNGWDAAHKAMILASLAYGFWVPKDQVYVEGIEELTAADIRFARQLGYRIKLLGVIKASSKLPGAEIEVRVHPTLIPEAHVLASVNGVFNAIAVHGDVVGDTLFYGRGAGQDPTTSAVLSDLAEAADALCHPRRNLGFTSHNLYGPCKPVDASLSEYYLRLAVADRPGVIAQIASILGELHIGISSILQPESDEEGSTVPLVMMIHTASHAQMHEAVQRIDALPCVQRPHRLLHVEHFS